MHSRAATMATGLQQSRLVWKMAVLTVGALFAGRSCVEGRVGVQAGVGARHEPTVAFVCNLPAMHLTDGGWVKDEETDCLHDPQAILDYCRKVYPTLDVRNIVEGSGAVTIKDWCPVGRARCHHHSHTVRPFRCLVGPFQSDALLVPRLCLFDHVHDPRACKGFDAWNDTALAACLGRRLALQSFAVIQPCGVDRFSGAEFVCCPATAMEQAGDDQEKPGRVIDLLSPPELDSSTLVPTGAGPSVSKDSAASTTTSSEDGAYVRYMQGQDKNRTEHEAYKQARNDLEKRHHQKVTKMMSEWTAAHQRVQEMKAIDAKGADKLNRQITARFQKMYDSLEQEGAAETKQLSAVHQQRVQGELNELKRAAMEAYMQALGEPQPSSVKVMRALKHYIKTEQKDRVHLITHYQHLQQSDPVEAESTFSHVADHLRVIDERLTRALDMLGRLGGAQERKIREHIEEFLSTYHSLDESLAVILAKMAERSSSTAPPTKPSPTPVTSFPPIVDIAGTTTTTATQPPTTQKPAEVTSEVPEAKSSQALPSSAVKSGHAAIAPPPAVVRPLNFDPSFDRLDDGMLEKHDDYVQIKQPTNHIAHIGTNQFGEAQAVMIKKVGGRSDAGMYLATPLGIAVCSVAVLSIIAMGVVVLRRRRGQRPSQAAAAQLSVKAAGPVVGGVVKPTQMNGYENPTHKYFDEQLQQQQQEEQGAEA